jgi:hypothetical protein
MPCAKSGDVVYYRWPNLKIGSNYYMRNSAVFSATDQIFYLPFNDAPAKWGITDGYMNPAMASRH